MAALLKNLLASMAGPSRPNPIRTGTGFNSGTLLGSPTPIPTVPDFNPLGKRKPQSPAPIPGVTGYGGSRPAPQGGRSTLLGR